MRVDFREVALAGDEKDDGANGRGVAVAARLAFGRPGTVREESKIRLKMQAGSCVSWRALSGFEVPGRHTHVRLLSGRCSSCVNWNNSVPTAFAAGTVDKVTSLSKDHMSAGIDRIRNVLPRGSAFHSLFIILGILQDQRFQPLPPRAYLKLLLI